MVDNSQSASAHDHEMQIKALKAMALHDLGKEIGKLKAATRHEGNDDRDLSLEEMIARQQNLATELSMEALDQSRSAADLASSPFSTVPDWIYRLDLKDYERRVLSVVYAFSAQGLTCRLSASTMATRLAMPEREVRRTLKRLTEAGLIVVLVRRSSWSSPERATDFCAIADRLLAVSRKADNHKEGSSTP